MSHPEKNAPPKGKPEKKDSIWTRDLLDMPPFQQIQKKASLRKWGGFWGQNTKPAFFAELAETARQKIPLVQALEIYAGWGLDRTPAVGKTSRYFRGLARGLLPHLQAGKPLSEAMRACWPAFDEPEIRFVRAGEEFGALDVALKRLSKSEKHAAIFRSMKMCLIYPAILSVFLLTVAFFILVKIMPKFVYIIESLGADLPPAARNLMRVSEWLIRYPHIVIGLVLLTILFFLRVRARAKRAAKQGKIQKSLLAHLPLFGEAYRGINEARWLAALAAALEAGIAPPDAIRAAGGVCGGWIERRSLEAAKSVEQGRPIGQACIENKVLRSWKNDRLNLLDWSGDFVEGLQHIAQDAEADTLAAVYRSARILEIVCILFFGAMNAFVLFGIYSCLFSLPKYVM